jgi:selenide, water dikinase
LVQTVDFFTPIVDDPYSFGAIAAANALSDVYAMGGMPLTVLNIACFSPEMAPAEVWASILKGAADKTIESGAVILGGHSVEDKEPKFGMAVTGTVDTNKMFVNTAAEPGDRIFLSKPLGTGIVTTAAKFDGCPEDVLQAAIQSMATLNRAAMEVGLRNGVRCATDITGFGLVGHLFNIAKSSNCRIVIRAEALPLIGGVLELRAQNFLTGGAAKNADFLGAHLVIEPSAPDWAADTVLDPQTSGGLALFAQQSIEGYPEIGWVEEGPVEIRIV